MQTEETSSKTVEWCKPKYGETADDGSNPTRRMSMTQDRGKWRAFVRQSNKSSTLRAFWGKKQLILQKNWLSMTEKLRFRLFISNL